AGTNDVVSAGGQTIGLPQGSYTTLKMLALGVNGNRPNRTFVVNYTDGTTQPFTQSVSDWATPQGYAGESRVLTMPYRDKHDGTIDGVKNHYIYGYSFALDSTRTVQSITLPNDANVEMLALNLVPLNPVPADLSASFNGTGIVTDGSTFSG